MKTEHDETYQKIQEICKICEEYIEDELCDNTEQCQVIQMKKNMERLKIYGVTKIRDYVFSMKIKQDTTMTLIYLFQSGKEL